MDDRRPHPRDPAKLDEDSGLLPRADLRRTEALAVLCIVGFDRSKFGPLFRTHPRTAVCVKRLQALEQRLQDAGAAVALDA